MTHRYSCTFLAWACCLPCLCRQCLQLIACTVCPAAFCQCFTLYAKPHSGQFQLLKLCSAVVQLLQRCLKLAKEQGVPLQASWYTCLLKAMYVGFCEDRQRGFTRLPSQDFRAVETDLKAAGLQPGHAAQRYLAAIHIITGDTSRAEASHLDVLMQCMCLSHSLVFEASHGKQSQQKRSSC